MNRFCRYCGKPLKEGAQFCMYCGKPIAAESSGTGQTAKPQPAQPQAAALHRAAQAPAQMSAPNAAQGVPLAVKLVIAAAAVAGIGVGIFFAVRHFAGSTEKKAAEAEIGEFQEPAEVSVEETPVEEAIAEEASLGEEEAEEEPALVPNWQFAAKEVDARAIWGGTDVREYVDPVYQVHFFLPSDLRVVMREMPYWGDAGQAAYVSDGRHESEYFFATGYSTDELNANSDMAECLPVIIQSDGSAHYYLYFYFDGEASDWIDSLYQEYGAQITDSAYVPGDAERPFYSFSVADDAAASSGGDYYMPSSAPAFCERTANGVKTLTAGADIRPDTYLLHVDFGAGTLTIADADGTLKGTYGIDGSLAMNEAMPRVELAEGDVITLDAADGDALAMSFQHLSYAEGLSMFGSVDGGGGFAQGDGQIFPDSSERLLTSSEVRALSDDELRLAINEIYARHGYTFKDQELLAYFRQFDWYEPTVPYQSFSQSVFNATETDNVKLMQTERDRRK